MPERAASLHRITPLLAAILLISVAPNLAGAQQVTCIINPSGGTVTIGSCIGSTSILWAVGILLSFALVAIAYMMGEVLALKSLKGWYKNELWETSKTIILIVVIFSVLIILSGIATALAGSVTSTNTNPQYNIQVNQNSAATEISDNLGGLYGVAGDYLQTASTSMTTSFENMLGAALGIDFLKGITYSVYFPLTWPPFVISNPYGSTGVLFVSNFIALGATQGSSMLSDAANLVVVPVMILMQMQYGLFNNIVELGFGLFIPLGIVFRAIPFLRGMGGTFIALGIGVSLVYPMVLVTVNIPVSDFILGSNFYGGAGFTAPTGCVLQTPTSSASAESGLICLMDTIANGVVDSIATAFTSITGVGTGIGAALGTFTSTSIYPIANLVTGSILNAIMQFVLLIIDFIIGYTIIKDIAQRLGGRVRLGFGKMSLA